jgi:hypothetical protein
MESMMNKITFLAFAACLALWCNAGQSQEDYDHSELYLEDGISEGFYGYWGTFYCLHNPADIVCALSTPQPYFGPAWYNYNYASWGLGYDHFHHHSRHRH